MAPWDDGDDFGEGAGFSKPRRASTVTRAAERASLLRPVAATGSSSMGDDDDDDVHDLEWKPISGRGFEVKNRLPFKAKDLFREFCDAASPLGAEATKCSHRMIRPGNTPGKAVRYGHASRSRRPPTAPPNQKCTIHTTDHLPCALHAVFSWLHQADHHWLQLLVHVLSMGQLQAGARRVGGEPSSLPARVENHLLLDTVRIAALSLSAPSPWPLAFALVNASLTHHPWSS
jgi:hypothetical protein